jgi:hypothetical protein
MSASRIWSDRVSVCGHVEQEDLSVDDEVANFLRDLAGVRIIRV